MKKISLFIFLISIFSRTYGQVITDTSILPYIGDIVNTVNCDTSGVTIGPPGTNQTFNYSTLSSIVPQNFQYLPADTLNGYNDFPTCNVKRSWGGGIFFSFFKLTADTLYAMGSYDHSNSASPHWSDKYPNGYPLINSSIIYDSLYTDSLPYVYYNETHSHLIVATTIIDATGTLILPDRNVDNVFRIRKTYTEYSSNQTLPTQYSENCSFYTAGTRAPLLSIISNNIKITNVDYLESVTGTKTEQILNNIGIVPNPFSEKINLDLFDIKGNKDISLIDIFGQVVFNGNTNNNSLEINTNEFNGGVYIVKIVTNDNTISRKLIKVQ